MNRTQGAKMKIIKHKKTKMKITLNFNDQKCTLVIIKLFKKINSDKYIYIYILMLSYKLWLYGHNDV